jgi:hypothetical protein
MDLLSLVWVCLSVLAPAAAGPPVADARVVLVQLEVVVQDAAGEAVRGLAQERFIVLDADAPQPIARFEEILASRAVLVLDVSASMGSRLWSARRAARDLLAAVGPGSEVAVLGCAERPLPLIGFTRDTARAAVMLSSPGRRAGEGTALVDCLGAALDMLDGAPGEGVVAVVTDGRDTFRDGLELEAAVADLARRLDASRLRLEVLGYGSPGWIGALAQASGGSWRSALAGRAGLEELGRGLGHHYQLGYYAPGRGTGWRPVSVRVEGAGLEVRAPAGYVLGGSESD